MSTILVDDEPLIRHAVVSVLEEAGYHAEGFGDAEELYRRLVEGDELPQLLILDQMLPDEDGAQIVHSLRERPRYRDIPVLFLTAVDNDSAERLADIAPVLRKPFDFRDLVNEVAGMIAGGDDRIPADSPAPPLSPLS
jgi:Response regulators consisting of a CheY-like receiver domain and a winged-helix DNA-binding domain